MFNSSAVNQKDFSCFAKWHRSKRDQCRFIYMRHLEQMNWCKAKNTELRNKNKHYLEKLDNIQNTLITLGLSL